MTPESPRLPSPPSRLRLSTEEDLLLACSWAPEGTHGQAQAERISGLCQEAVHWPRFLSLVRRHRIQALAHLNLSRHGRNRLPREVHEELQHGAITERMGALRQGAECLRLVRRFASAGLPVMPLQGAVLSWQLYGDPALRQGRDLELLVPGEEAGQALALLAQEGYHPLGEPPAGPGLQSLWNPRRAQRLDLHWQSYDRMATQGRTVWERSRPFPWLGVHLEVLEDATLLACLCQQGAGRAWARCQWLGDVAMLLAREPAAHGPDRATAARDLGAPRQVAQAALLVHWLYRLPLEPALAGLVQSQPGCQRLAVQALGFLRAGERLSFRQRVGQLAYTLHLEPPGGRWAQARQFLRREWTLLSRR